MPSGKKITKFKSKKGAPPSGAKKSTTLGGGASNVKKSSKVSSTAHALPSQSEVLHQQAVQPPVNMAVPPPPLPSAVKPSQSQTMRAPQPPIPGNIPPATPIGAQTGAAPIYHPPPPGVMKAHTVQGHPSGVMKTKTQTPEENTSVKQQMEIKIEELTDQVNNLLEVADSLLGQDWSPDNIIDIVHVVVRSLNLDVVSMVLPSMEYPKQLDNILSRGYDISPRKAAVNLWLNCFDEQEGIDWKKLMKLASDNKSELAYWVIHEGLFSIGYVPIRDGEFIYGFLFVASKEKKEQSQLTSALLDLCGSRIGLSYALKYIKGAK